MDASLDIHVIKGPDIKQVMHELGQLRIDVFREFPYLYDGDLEYEQKYLKAYTESPGSIAVLALDGKKVVGASTGLPLIDETVEFRSAFKDSGYPVETVFYCGESILLPRYRGKGVYKHFFHEREEHARSLGRYKTITFCAVQRPENHPHRPAGYRPLDPVWKKFGYRKVPEINTTYHWTDIGRNTESGKKMIFWIKSL
jgi:GNAT superfamily N-acetyltransferase